MVWRGGRYLCSLLILTAMGPTTTLDIDDCSSGPCMNGGTCMDLVNAYTCSCLDGFNGTHCEFDIRECDSTPCKNNGTCFDATNYYNCTCLPGFIGTYCETTVPGTSASFTGLTPYTIYRIYVRALNFNSEEGTQTSNESVPSESFETLQAGEVKVTASRTSNDTISKGDDFTLACRVNLAGIDLDEVAWYRDSVELPNETGADYMVDSNPDMGMYSITILVADALDTGTYRCTAVTKENQFNASSEDISADVVVRGKIDLELSKLEDYIQLNQTASLNCTVFSTSNASIAWERNGVRLVNGMNRTRIEPSQEMGTGGTYFFSVLNVSYIVRGDNGIYMCLAFDGAGIMTDSGDFNIFVQEVAELANPEYLNVRSKQLQLVWDFTVQGNDDEINCIAKYGIQDTNETEQDVGGTSPGVPLLDLEPYTTYKFQLICVNLAGSSEPLDFPPERTLAGKPSKPRNVRISEIEARQVFVQWDEPEVENGPIDVYILTARSEKSDYIYPVPGTSASFTGLTPYTIYRIYVRALNFNSEEGTQTSNESVPSESFETLQAAPGEPVGLTVDDSPTECIISWGQPSEPNGVIKKYTLYEEVLKMGTDVVDKTQKVETPATQLQITFMKAGLDPFSIFRYSITASTAPGEGVTATTTDVCETPQGVPVAPQSIPTPNDSGISQTSFTTTLLPYDARNGPISCCEVIVVELQSGDPDLDSSDPSYGPAQIKSYEEAKNTKGTPYRAVVFSNCPANGVLVIGASTGDVSTCNTVGSAGSASRRRRQTTGASTLTAVNGPLNTGGIYSTFVRVYTPSPEDSQMAFYESGPFMVPVTLNLDGKGTGVPQLLRQAAPRRIVCAQIRYPPTIRPWKP
eukprot:XP_011679776.1 PREDICTED: receptor-type tyrosine-protein phosphatase delta [Strongylocentrotus purpuratus]